MRRVETGTAVLRNERQCVAKKIRLALLTLLAAPAMSALAAIPSTERAALQSIYASANGANWNNRSGWNSAPGTECTWYGITCDANQTTVVQIDLSTNNLSGSLPPLSSLKNLQVLDVAQNDQLGGSVPPLTSLIHLQSLIAYSNQFSGALPDLTGLTNLQTVHLWNNKLTGSIPKLVGLSNLQNFHIDRNQLTGAIPELAGLTNLKLFGANTNQLTGPIPTLDGLVNLTQFDVSYNQLSGSVPTLAGLTGLQSFGIGYNNLSGSLPMPPSSLVSGRSQLCPNALLTRVDDPTWDSATLTTPWYKDCAAAANLAITSINGGSSPVVGAKFSVTVQAQDTNGTPVNVANSTAIRILLVKGNGTLSDGNNGFNCVILAGDNACSAADLAYSTAESGIRIGAYTLPTSDYLRSIPSASFTVTSGSFFVGGTVSGMNGTGLILSLNSDAQTISMDRNGAFTFPMALGDGAYYSVGVKVQPVSPRQACIVNPSYGTITGKSVTDILVSCANVYSVTPSAGAHGLIGPPTIQSVSAGTIIVFLIQPDVGYAARVSGTCGGALVGQLYTTNPITADCTVIANFDPVNFTVTPSAGPNGTISPATPQVIGLGAHASFTITPDTGYQATVGGTCGGGWSGAGSTSYTTMAITADCTVVASFNRLTTSSTTTLTSFANPSIQNQGVVFEAIITGNSPTGSVTFNDGYSALAGCNSVPLHLVSGKFIAYCAATFGVAAMHAITASYSGDALNAASNSGPLAQTVTPATAFNPNQFGISGSWYNAATSGQGFEIEVLPDYLGVGKGVFFAGWFTYDASGGAPRWYTLQGETNSTGASASLGIFQAVGGNFNAPPKVGTSSVGTATLTFADCTHATLSYTFQDGSNRKGIIPLTRLSVPTACTAAGDNNSVVGSDYFLSGAWYNATTSGQGVVFDISPSQTTLFGAWYTYALNGQSIGGSLSQRWFTLQTNSYVPGSRTANAAIYSATGGVFDDPTPITNRQVGTATINFASCNSLNLSYTFTSGEFAGQSGSTALTPVGPAPKGCQ